MLALPSFYVMFPHQLICRRLISLVASPLAECGCMAVSSKFGLTILFNSSYVPCLLPFQRFDSINDVCHSYLGLMCRLLIIFFPPDYIQRYRNIVCVAQNTQQLFFFNCTLLNCLFQKYLKQNCVISNIYA